MRQWKLNETTGIFHTFIEEEDMWVEGEPTKGDLIQVTYEYSYTYYAQPTLEYER